MTPTVFTLECFIACTRQLGVNWETPIMDRRSSCRTFFKIAFQKHVILYIILQEKKTPFVCVVTRFYCMGVPLFNYFFLRVNFILCCWWAMAFFWRILQSYEICSASTWHKLRISSSLISFRTAPAAATPWVA